MDIRRTIVCLALLGGALHIGCRDEVVTSKIGPPTPQYEILLPAINMNDRQRVDAGPILIPMNQCIALQGSLLGLGRDERGAPRVGITFYDQKQVICGGVMAEAKVVGAETVEYRAILAHPPEPGTYQLVVSLVGNNSALDTFVVEIR